VDLTPISGGDGVYTQVTVAGQTAWQNTGTSRYLYARRPNSFAFTVGQTLYVRVTYFDDASGTIDLQFDAQTSNARNSTLHTRTTRVNSGRFVDCFFELPDVRFNKSLNGSDFRIVTGTTNGAKVPVSRITLSDTPFADPDFQLAITRPWQSRYTGPAKDYVDPTTLKGKVMAGYQGWFRAPNDIEDGGWRHWISGQTMAPENFTIDMWPDLTEYDPASLFRAADIMTAGGAPAHIFSSASYPAVLKHFRWMRKHNIDGAWLQRFRMHAGSEADFVLRNVSQAAAEEGRVWGVEYDVSGKSDSAVLGLLQADWQWLTSQFDILNDPRYVREDGKPVVFIWGLSVPDRNFTPATADAVVDWFQAQGCHVIGGIPNVWSTLSAAWQTHIAKYDGVLVWQSSTTSEVATFNNRGQDYYPHIWPGFSWAHLKEQPANPPVQFTDRQGGQFYWDKGRTWINAGADRLFLGMFDEYDEGTAIMPMTDDPPPPYTEWGRFLNNQGKPSDWWMMLSDELKRMMWGQRANTGTLPTVASLANRSNIGAEASIDLGATDITNSLTRANNADGDTVVETVGGLACRGNLDPATDRYMYFKVADSFAYQMENGDVTIEVEYYDITGNTVVGLQYDSTSTVPANPAFTNHPQNITTTGSNTWRTVRFEIADAYFGNRQNGGADFRFNFNGKKLNINRVWVRLPEPKAYPFTWTNATAGPALNWSQNANWLGGIVGQSDPTSVVRILPDQTMPGGSIAITNNVAGQVFNQLQLGGTAFSSADTTVTLGGNALSLGGTAPAIMLDATKSAFDITYDIAAPVTLLGTTQVGGAGDALLRISGAMAGSGGLTKTHAGLLTLNGANTYSGPTILNAGILQIGNGGTIGALSPSSTITNHAGLVFNRSNAVTQGADFANAITGTGSVAQSGGGILTLVGTNSHQGGTILNSGTIAFGNGALGTVGNITFLGNSTLQWASGNTQDVSGRLVMSNGVTSTIDTNGNDVSFGSAIGNSSTGNLSKTGAGTLTLAGANTYLGDTNLLAGNLQLGTGDDRLPVATRLNLGNNASTAEFDLNGRNQQIAGLAIAAGATAANNSVNNSSVTPATLTVNTVAASPSSFGGILKGNLGLTKTGADTLTLTGSNTYTGSTVLSAGTLEIGGSGRLGGGTYAADISISGGAVLRHTSSLSQTLSGVISGAGSLVKDTGGQLTLSGANNSFGGGVTIRNGTLQSTTTNTTLGSGTVTMGGGGSTGATYLTGRSNSNAFIIDAPDSGSVVIGANGAGSGFTLSGPITLNGNLTFQTFANTGTGTPSSASISGGITGTGNLLLNNFGSRANFININSTAINHSGSITLQGEGTGNVSISANIGPNVTGIIQNSASSLLILGGANNTFSGNTTVNTGTLRITQAANPANANPGNDASTVTIAATGATLDLTYTGTDKVDKLFIGATPMADGVYGKSGSASPIIGIPQITGNGTLTVGDPGFAFWIAGPFTNGQVPVDQRGPNDDFDKDGVRNLIEYAIAGQDPTVPNATVGSFTDGLLSFAKRQGTTGLSYAIEESTDLGVADDWDEVSGINYVNDPNTISYPLTPGTPPTNFLRLKVMTQTP
jgi:autotransporter-associated beta strand protein